MLPSRILNPQNSTTWLYSLLLLVWCLGPCDEHLLNFALAVLTDREAGLEHEEFSMDLALRVNDEFHSIPSSVMYPLDFGSP